MYSLLFELNAIQSYLFASGRLRDMIGASELVDLLTNEQAEDNLLDSVLDSLNVREKIAFSRRAGGAFYAFSEDQQALTQLQDLWTLSVQQWAPGLPYSLGMSGGSNHSEAFSNAREAMRRDSSRHRPVHPVGAPIAHRIGRTGMVAEGFDRRRNEPVDAPGMCKKRFSDLGKAVFLSRFSPPEAGLDWRDWPRNLELNEDGEDGYFPFLGDDRTLAVIHADGNGLGQLLLRIKNAVEKEPGRFMDYYQQFTELVESATQYAARMATQDVLIPTAEEEEGSECLPARPLLLGGDDISLLVRGDLALDYVQCFSAAFEKESENLMRKLALPDMPPRLTLGFGVVFIQASKPFHMTMKLCEQLMEAGKREAKVVDRDNPPATVVLQRVTTSLVDDYARIVTDSLTHTEGDDRYIDTLGTYALHTGKDLPALSDLRALATLLGEQDMARGSTRQLLTLMGLSPGQARMRYQRWRRLMGENETMRGYLERFDDLLRRLLVSKQVSADLPYSNKDSEGCCYSPLGDALDLRSVGAARSMQEVVSMEEGI